MADIVPAVSICISEPAVHVEPLNVAQLTKIPEATSEPVSFCQIVSILPVPITQVSNIYAPSVPDDVSMA